MIVPFATKTRRGAVSDFLPVALGPLPDAPAAPDAKYDEQTLTLSWKAATGTSYQIYDVTSPAAKTPGLSQTLLTAGEWKRPVTFNARVCFALRAVRTAGPVQFESAPSAPWCGTPADTFPPPAPTGLVAFASEGSIDLTWEPVTAADLAGYLVLRSDGTSDTLRPLMTTPVTTPSFKDSSAKSGVRYIYAVVAVDNAAPANRSKESNRVEETGRTQR